MGYRLRGLLFAAMIPVALASMCCAPKAPVMDTVPAAPALPPRLQDGPEYLPAFDVHLVVVDGDKGMPLWAEFTIAGWPDPLEGWFGVIRTNGTGHITVIVRAPGYMPQRCVLTPGVHLIVMIRQVRT
jgi:hypothetical protein